MSGLYEGIREFGKRPDPFFKTTAIDHSAIPPQGHFIRKPCDWALTSFRAKPGDPRDRLHFALTRAPAFSPLAKKSRGERSPLAYASSAARRREAERSRPITLADSVGRPWVYLHPQFHACVRALITTFAGLPAMNMGPDVRTGTPVSAFLSRFTSEPSVIAWRWARSGAARRRS
jgi:hypothetical protein